MAIQDMYNNLTEEQKKKVKACKDQKELLRVMSEESIELTDEQMEAISGGGPLADWADSLPDEDIEPS